MKNTILLSALVITIMASCGSGSSGSSSTSAKSTAAEPAAKPAEPETTWTYSSDTDQMTSKVVYYAENEAKDGLKLKFPYEGSTGSLVVRQKDGKNEVIVRVTKGQMLAANPVDGGQIRVRFDNDAPESYTVSGPSDGSSETVFVTASQKFLTRLKTASKVLVEAEFFDNGAQRMEFNTTKFTWAH